MQHNYESDTLGDGLGLSKTRVEELTGLLQKAFNDAEETWTVRNMVRDMLPHIKGEEEAFLVAYGLGSLAERCNSSDQEAVIEAFVIKL